MIVCSSPHQEVRHLFAVNNAKWLCQTRYDVYLSFGTLHQIDSHLAVISPLRGGPHGH